MLQKRRELHGGLEPMLEALNPPAGIRGGGEARLGTSARTNHQSRRLPDQLEVLRLRRLEYVAKAPWLAIDSRGITPCREGLPSAGR